MFACERCGSRYSASHLGVEHCPRCKLRDRVEAPLAFKAFRLPGTQPEVTLSEVTLSTPSPVTPPPATSPSP
jgi:hypothetical protein